MNDPASMLPSADAGLWLGLVLTLVIFSGLIRDHWLFRLALYLVVGAGLGYLALLACRHVLWPRLFVPLLQGPETDFGAWLALGLGVAIWAAGIHSLRRPSNAQAAGSGEWLRWVGMVPAGLMLGTALGAGIAGALQGSLWPQFRRAAALGISPEAGTALFATGLLALTITTGSLLAFYGDPAWPGAGFLGKVVRGWRWLGRRALWLAAGVIFARLLASRMSLLIARLDYLLFGLRDTGAWQWLESFLNR